VGTFLTVVETVSTLAGDYNDDGVVDAADYTAWRDNLGGSTLLNETASLGVVDEADYDAWKANFDAMGGAGGGSRVAVPEPSSAMLISMGLVALVAATVQRVV
jgi:hypothetical protein